MKVFVTTEERFARTSDGHIWSGGSGSYSFWTRYLDVFDNVAVLARIADTKDTKPSWKKADGAGVNFHTLPYAVGPAGHARQMFAIRRAIRDILTPTDALIVRAFSTIATHIEAQLSPLHPFGMELVGDPYEVFAPGCLDHPLRPFLRWYFTKQLRRQCRKACAVAYVTRDGLQRRYRPGADCFTTVYSSIELREDAFRSSPRTFDFSNRPVRVVSIGSLERPYKGFDVLIEAIAACIRHLSPLEIRIAIIGEGRCRAAIQQQINVLGLEHHVSLVGQIPSGQAVRDELDRSDLFVLPSRSEGLPRAMIEAMARGLPCIGTSIGGIPELLDSSEMVPKDDSPALATMIEAVLTNPDRMTRLSTQNLIKAREYHDNCLSRRRREFLETLRRRTELWNRGLQMN